MTNYAAMVAPSQGGQTGGQAGEALGSASHWPAKPASLGRDLKRHFKLVEPGLPQA
jgi:hypothetical protein